MSPPHTHALGDADGSASQSPLNAANDLGMDDEACSVCTNKCTCTSGCNSTNARSTTSSTTPDSGHSPASSGAADPFTAPVPPSSLSHPSLKIKLTLPPKLSPAFSPTISKSAHSRGLPHKKKSNHAGETLFAEGNVGGPSTSQTLQVSASNSAGGSSTGAAGLSSSALKKKRGRPPKTAPKGARMQPLSGGTANFSDAGHHQRAPITHVTASRPQSKKITTNIKGKANASKIARKLQGSAQNRRPEGSSQTNQRKKIIHVLDDESSELSELDDEDDLDPYGLPTFVTALSSSSNSSSSSDSGSSESGSEASFNSHSESSKGSSRSSRDNSPHGDDVISERKRGHRYNWNMRMRRRESGSVGLSDADMDSTDSDPLEEEDAAEEMGEGDDNEEDIEDLGYPQLARYSGIATGWTDDEGESSFDAELFFANLSETDTSAYVSDDEQMGDAENGFGDDDGQDEEDEQDAMDIEHGYGGVDVVRLSEMAAAGFLAPFSDIERSGAGPSWDQLISSSIRDQLPNLDARQAREAYLSSTLELTVPGYKEAEAMMATSEEEEAVAMFDNDDYFFDQDPAEEDNLEMFDGSDEGDTTEDEFVDVDGIATPRREILLRFPASLGAIDPMSTVSSPIRPISKPRDKKVGKLTETNSASNIEQRKAKKEARKPSEILSGKVFEDSEKENVDTTGSSPRAPPMGSFIYRPSEVPTRAVIAAHSCRSERSIPSPYPATRRARRGRGGSLSAISYSGSDRSFLSRPSSFLSARRSSYEPTGQPCIDETEDTDTQMPDSMRLDDVFDTTFLEAATSEAIAPPPDSALTMQSFETDPSDTERGLHRWDRVPINAFRKSRQATTGVELGLSERAAVTRTPHAPRPSDGFSYGSATGGMLRGSPLTPSLWETTGSPGIKNEQARAAAMDKMSLLLSPVLLPPRDDNKTPTPSTAANDQRQKEEEEQQLLFGYETHPRSGQSQNNHQQHHAANLKTRKEMRKEKKRNKKFVGGPPHVRHNHFPNARGRASGSMQRSASVPSLSL